MRSFSQLLLACLDGFIPPALGSAPNDVVRRTRLTIAIGAVSGVAVLATLIVASDQPDSPTIRALSYTFCALLLSTPLLVRLRVEPSWLQHGLIAAMVAYALILTITTGGADTGGSFVAILCPLFAVLLCGVRAGLIWSGLTCTALLALAVAITLGYDAPVDPNPTDVARWTTWATSAGIVATVSVAVGYEWLRETMLEELDEARAVADREATQRRRVEESFRNDLERLVEQRTEELEESRRQLRRADRLASIGTLAAGVAHQINNPMGSILLSSEVALTTRDPRERERIYREALERNVADAKRCGEIVRNLLRFSRSSITDRAVLDLNVVAGNAVETLREPTDRFTLRFSAAPIPISANAIEIEQVVVNLLSNALQSGSDKVEVSTARVGNQATLAIRDHGHGIKEADQERLFDPFFTTRVTEGGTGLGLSIVHSIVDEHRGKISVDSQIGRGSCFFVSLPLASAGSL